MGNRRSRKYGEKEQYKIKVFGNSFAYGHGSEDDETFEYMMEEKTGWECLNYGVGAYGTDQAFLKYKDSPIKTKYTLLCILDENIGRCVNIWRRFYFKKSGVIVTKPRFAISDSNSIFLIDNPIKDYSDLQKLKDIQFINSLKKYDYWQTYFKELNMPPKLKWPATLVIFPHLDFWLKEFVTQVKMRCNPTEDWAYEAIIARYHYEYELPYHLYNNNSEGIKIMHYIIGEFVKTARLRKEIPIVVIFPGSYSMDIISRFDRKPYQSLVKYLEVREYNFIDFGDVFIKEKYHKYYDKDKDYHFGTEGSEKVADEIIQYINHLERQS